MVSLGKEIFFAPLTHFQRVRAVAESPRSIKVRHLRDSTLALIGSQMFYLFLAAGFIQLVTGEKISNVFAAGLPFFCAGAAISILVSLLWHWANNWRDFPQQRLRHLYIASNRALIRSMMVANAAFFVGVGVATFRAGEADAALQASLLSFSFVGLAGGAAMRLTLAIIHFEPLVQAKQERRFYIDTLIRRRSFCAALFVLGLVFLCLAAAFLTIGTSPQESSGLWSRRFGIVVLAYGGLSLLVGGMITAWGFVFPLSFLFHLFLWMKSRRGRSSAVRALARHPVVYDELFLLPTPGFSSLLRDISRHTPERQTIEWLAFVLTQTYKRRPAARALGEAIDAGKIRAAAFLHWLREEQVWPDAPSIVAEHMRPSPIRTLFSHLTGVLTLDDVSSLREQLQESGASGPLSVISWQVCAIENLVGAASLEEWPWPGGYDGLTDDPLRVNPLLLDLEQAKKRILGLSEHTSYAERSLAFNHAIISLRTVRERFLKDPWLASICTPAFDRWNEHLHEQMSRSLSSAQLEIYVVPAPLQQGTKQDLRLVVTNHGPGRARDLTVHFRAEGMEAVSVSHLSVLPPRHRQDFILAVHPQRIGSLVGEVEILYTDDLRERRRKLHPLELLAKGSLSAFRDFTNPFIAGPPLSDGSIFQGRKQVLELFDNPGRPSLHILGPRRIGKTSLLYQLRNRARDQARPWAMLDLQPLSTQTRPNLLELRIADSLLPGMGINDLSEALHLFVQNGPHPVLFIDEGDYFPTVERVLSTKLSAELRGVLNSEVSLQVILARPAGGRPITDDSFGQLLAMLRPYRLNPLSNEEVLDLLVKPLDGLLDVLPRAVDDFVRLVGGHPYIAQLLAQAIVANAKDRRQVLIDEVLVEDTANESLGHLDGFFRTYQWRGLAEGERKLLLTVAHGSPTEHPNERALNELRERCLITGSGIIRISMGLFERWLLREDTNLLVEMETS